MVKRAGRRRGLVLAMSVFVALSSNCTTSRGRTQLVHVRSAPPDAQVSLNGEPVGDTPLHVEVRRRDADPVLRVQRAGFEPAERRLQRRLSGWFFWGDLAVASLMGGVAFFGAGIDAGGIGPGPIGYGALAVAAVLAPSLALGTAFEFPNDVDVVLRRLNGGSDGVGGTVREPLGALFDACSVLVHGALGDPAGDDDGDPVVGRGGGRLCDALSPGDGVARHDSLQSAGGAGDD